MAEKLESGRHLGQQRGVAKGLAQDHMPNVQLGILRGQIRERRPPFKERALAKLQVIDEPERINLGSN
jgi:hypothetical protein